MIYVMSDIFLADLMILHNNADNCPKYYSFYRKRWFLLLHLSLAKCFSSKYIPSKILFLQTNTIIKYINFLMEKSGPYQKTFSTGSHFFDRVPLFKPEMFILFKLEYCMAMVVSHLGDNMLDNSKLARAGGPGFWDF